MNNTDKHALWKENLQVVRYCMEKCQNFLNAKTPEEALPPLWHVSQLTHTLPDDILEEIIQHAVQHKDFRLRYEICYLVGLLGKEDKVNLLKALENDPEPEVREAFRQLNAMKFNAPSQIEIAASSSDLWEDLPILNLMRTELLPKKTEKEEEKKDPITKSVLNAFRQWLSQHPAPDEKRFLVGTQHLSAKDLVAEIEEGSDLGIRLLEMVMRVILKRHQKGDSGKSKR